MTRWTARDVIAVTINPYYAINIATDLTVPHAPLVTEADWIAANKALLAELGSDAYLRWLLAVLKGDRLIFEENV